MSSDQISPETPLPELFQNYPETRVVFNRWGLRGCGGEGGPAESVDFFARAHGVDRDQLIGELERVINDPLARQAALTQLHEDNRPLLSDAIYRPFFLAGLAIILTLGAAWGAFLLVRIAVAGAFTSLSVHEVNAHGHAQVMGWVGLFIMGFAYQAFPRMWHVSLPRPQWAIASWAAMLVGICCRSAAMMLTGTVWAIPVHSLGIACEVFAVVTFVLLLGSAFAASRQTVRPYIAFAFAALGFFVVQTVYSGWHIHQLMVAESRDALLAQIATFQGPLRDMQIQGMAMLMIFGVSIRMFPAIFGLPEIADRRAWVAFFILLAAIILEVGLFITYRLGDVRLAAASLLLPWLLLPVGAALIVGPWRLWRPLPKPGRDDRSGKFIRVAFLWLFVSFAMLLLLPVYRSVSGIPFSHAYYGATRHAITVGFISLMIVGVAAKVVPTLRGVPSERLPRLWLPFILINAGCALRVALQIGTDWSDMPYRLIGLTGALEWTGLAIWAGHLAAIMLGWGRYGNAGKATWGPAPEQIEGEHRVAAALAWDPLLEDVFVRYGFDLIRNPLLRNTVARQVTLRQACRMKNVDEVDFLVALNNTYQRPSATPDAECCAGQNRQDLVSLNP